MTANNTPESFDAVVAEMLVLLPNGIYESGRAVLTRLQSAHAAEVAEQQATIESLRDILYEAVGDDANDWESGDGWPMGRFLVPALSRDYNRAASEFAAYIAERVSAAAEESADELQQALAGGERKDG